MPGPCRSVMTTEILIVRTVIGPTDLRNYPRLTHRIGQCKCVQVFVAVDRVDVEDTITMDGARL